MASIVTRAGRRAVQFIGPDGKRFTLSLGKVSQRAAEQFAGFLDRLVAARKAGLPLDGPTAAWLAGLPPATRQRLAAAGLIDAPAGERPVVTLGDFLTQYIAGRDDVKALTTRNLRAAAAELIAFFGEDRRIDAITAADADDYRRALRRRLGENTVRRLCGRARQFFRAAIRRRLLSENPFGDMRDVAVQPNKSREFFVSREAIAAVLDACPDAQWRLLVALARYGGLRVPSETLALTWEHVDWARGRLRVPSPKTERHAGRGERVIPLFPELRPHVEECFELAEPGVPWIITRYRDSAVNLRTQLLRIIRRAGLSPWPKLWQNLRASRATELAAQFPQHVAAAWCGHTVAIAAKHYWTVRDEDYEAAIAPAPTDVQRAAIALQQAHADKCAAVQTSTASSPQVGNLQQGDAPKCLLLHDLIPPRGVELPLENPGENAPLGLRAAKMLHFDAGDLLIALI
jgi:integrase